LREGFAVLPNAKRITGLMDLAIVGIEIDRSLGMDATIRVRQECAASNLLSRVAVQLKLELDFAMFLGPVRHLRSGLGVHELPSTGTE
jgi:hypothetical protein